MIPTFTSPSRRDTANDAKLYPSVFCFTDMDMVYEWRGRIEEVAMKAIDALPCGKNKNFDEDRKELSFKRPKNIACV